MKDPRMVDALLWNMLAWALWGILILGIRYYVERHRQKIAALEAKAALEATSA